MLLFQNVLVGLSGPEYENDTWKSGTATNATRVWTPSRASTPNLLDAGIRDETISLSVNKQWIQFDAHAEEVEDLLFTEFFEYEHLDSGGRTIAVEEYHTPLHLYGHLDYITACIKLRADSGRVKSIRRRQAQDAEIAVARRTSPPLISNGVTVVEFSEDYGVGSYADDGGWETGCAGPDGGVFYPSADVTCPYVLSVGATRFNHLSDPNDTTSYYETFSGYSGGGFSNDFDAPEWQKDAIARYFDEVTLDFTGYEEAGTNFSDVGSGVYRTGGREYPDVSSIGEHYISFTEGRWARERGTSLSAPIWGAVITLINERRLAANKSTVGFLHPVLYAHPEVFTGITEGNNTACNSTGFLAAKGWDPVSGLGTPIFPKLIDLFLGL